MAAADIHYQVAEVYGEDFLVTEPVKVKCRIWHRNVDTPVLVQRERAEGKQNKTKQCLKQVLSQISDLLHVKVTLSA